MFFINFARESVVVAVGNGIISGNQDKQVTPAGLATKAESTAVIKRMLKRLELIEGLRGSIKIIK